MRYRKKCRFPSPDMRSVLCQTCVVFVCYDGGLGNATAPRVCSAAGCHVTRDSTRRCARDVGEWCPCSWYRSLAQMAGQLFRGISVGRLVAGMFESLGGEWSGSGQGRKTPSFASKAVTADIQIINRLNNRYGGAALLLHANWTSSVTRDGWQTYMYGYDVIKTSLISRQQTGS